MVTGAEHQKTGENVQSRFRNIAKPALLLLAGVTLAASVHFANPVPVSAYQEASLNPAVTVEVSTSSPNQAEVPTISEIKERLKLEYGVVALDSLEIDGVTWGSNGDVPLFPLEPNMLASSWHYEELLRIFQLYKTGFMPLFEDDFYLVKANSIDERDAYFTTLADGKWAIVYGVSPEGSFNIEQQFGEDASKIEITFLHELTHMALSRDPEAYMEFMDMMMELGTEWMDRDILTGLDAVYREDLNNKWIYIQFTEEDADQFRRNDQDFKVRLRDLQRDDWYVVDVSNLGYPGRLPGSIYLIMRPGATNYLPTEYSLSSPKEAFAEMGALMLYKLIYYYRGQIPYGCSVELRIREEDKPACGFYRFYYDLFSGGSISMN